MCILGSLRIVTHKANSWLCQGTVLTHFEDEARSGSMDSGCITPLYVYRMWGGCVAIEDIATGLKELRKTGFMEIR